MNKTDKTAKMMTRIIMFYGKECPHCHRMMPLLKRLKKEEGIAVRKLEVWHNEKNADLMQKHHAVITESSGGEFGVPAFMDEKGTKALVGEFPYPELKKWALKRSEKVGL